MNLTIPSGLEQDPRLFLEGVLLDAVQRVYEEAERLCPDPSKETLYLDVIRQAWLRSLRSAFASRFDTNTSPQLVAVYGGKPGNSEVPYYGVATGLRQWAPRWEFLYDISVLRVQWIDAAYAHNNQVALVTDAIWIVESEIAGDGAKVAEDVSKLRVGRAENMLLIAAQTTQAAPDKWLEFLGKTLKGVEGRAFLALLPSYASGNRGAQRWLGKTVEIDLYECDSRTGKPQVVSKIKPIAAAA